MAPSTKSGPSSSTHVRRGAPSPKINATQRRAERIGGLLSAVKRSTPVVEINNSDNKADAAVVSAATTPTSSPTMAFTTRMATALHTVYLISLTERAQNGLAHVGTNVEATSPTWWRVVPSARWLEAASIACRRSFDADDVARLAVLFPRFIRAEWQMPSQQAQQSSLMRVMGEDEGSTTLIQSAVPTTTEHLLQMYLVGQHTPSVEEASKLLEDTMREVGNAAAQQEWRARVAGMTAHQSWLAQVNATPSPRTSELDATPATHDVEGTTVKGPRKKAPLTAAARKAAAAAKKQRDAHMKSLSADLRSHLSSTKLAEVLGQMDRDARRVDAQERERIEQRQVQERLLGTYEHVRSVMGKRSSMNLSEVLHALREESRDEGHRATLRELSLLLRSPNTGLRLTRLDWPIRTTPTTTTTTPSSGRGRRAKTTKPTAAVATPAVIDVAPTMLNVANVEELKQEEMEWCLLHHDRSLGSIQRLAAEVAEACPRL